MEFKCTKNIENPKSLCIVRKWLSDEIGPNVYLRAPDCHWIINWEPLRVEKCLTFLNFIFDLLVNVLNYFGANASLFYHSRTNMFLKLFPFFKNVVLLPVA